MRVYLDHLLISAIPNRDLAAEEDVALARLRRRSKRRGLKLVASKVHRREIERAPIQHRSKYYQALHRFPEVEFVEDNTLLGFNHQDMGRYGFLVSPRIENNPISERLRTMGVKRVDAHHLTVAIERHCDVFLTCDGGVLYRRQQIEKEYPIRVMRPSQLMKELTGKLKNGAR